MTIHSAHYVQSDALFPVPRSHYILVLYRCSMHTICMKRRMHSIIEDDDQKAMALIWRVYGLSSDATAIRFALRKLMRDEEEPHRVQREQRDRRSST